MKLNNDNEWVAVNLGSRTILRSDRNLYPRPTWEYLVSKVEVEPTTEKGYYRVITE